MDISSEIKENILDIIFKYIDKNKTTVFLFGSYAQGEAKKVSDIDIIDFTDDLNEIFKRNALEKVEIWHKGKESKISLTNLKGL